MTDEQLFAICLLVGTFFLAVYGIFTGLALVRAHRASLAVPRANSGDRRSVSDGEPFEAVWGGAQGYEDAPARTQENLVSHLVVSTVTPLRPSRFQDSSYWRTYLPIVAGIEFMMLIGLPLLALLLVPAAPPTTFQPTAAQRSALVRGSAAAQPDACNGAGPVKVAQPFGPDSGSVTDVDYSADGSVFTVHPGAHLVISYYGSLRPSFAPESPLCPVAGHTPTRASLDYVATRRGTGYVYFPQFDRSAFVARIDVVGPEVPVAIEVIAVSVLAVVVELRLRLRRYGR